MQSINTNVQISYTPSIAAKVFEFEDLQNVLCSYLTPWQKTCLLSTNKTLEPARWTQGFSFGKDKVKVSAFKELIHNLNSLEAAKKECYDKAVLDFKTLCNDAHMKHSMVKSDLCGIMVYHDKWNLMTTNLFKEIITSEFKIPINSNENTIIEKNRMFNGESWARIKLQALSWVSSSAWEAEQILRNSENLDLTTEKFNLKSLDIFLSYPSVKQNKNRGECPISNEVFFDLMKKIE